MVSTCTLIPRTNKGTPCYTTRLLLVTDRPTSTAPTPSRPPVPTPKNAPTTTLSLFSVTCPLSQVQKKWAECLLTTWTTWRRGASPLPQSLASQLLPQNLST